MISVMDAVMCHQMSLKEWGPDSPHSCKCSRRDLSCSILLENALTEGKCLSQGQPSFQRHSTSPVTDWCCSTKTRSSISRWHRTEEVSQHRSSSQVNWGTVWLLSTPSHKCWCHKHSVITTAWWSPLETLLPRESNWWPIHSLTNPLM